MVHVVAPRPAHPNLPLFFNVDGAVGANAPNTNPDDVMLVQYLIKLIGAAPDNIGAGPTPLFQQVEPTGSMDEKTIAAIKAIQGVEKKTADGRVSTALGYRYGAEWYTIVDLNFSIRDRSVYNKTWPNLDKMPGCPMSLAAAIRGALTGKSPPRA